MSLKSYNFVFINLLIYHVTLIYDRESIVACLLAFTGA